MTCFCFYGKLFIIFFVYFGEIRLVFKSASFSRLGNFHSRFYHFLRISCPYNIYLLKKSRACIHLEFLGKTGTSEKWQDLWYCGYTPQLSCAVWTGADPQRQMYEYDWCKNMWRTFMTKALQHYETESFTSANNPVYDSPFNLKQKKLLTKKAIEEAKKALQGLNGDQKYEDIKGLFNSDYITIEEKYEYSSTVKEGVVINIEWRNDDLKQWDSIQGGSVTVIITISKGHDPASTITANVVGMSESAAIKALIDAGFGTPSVSQEYSATVPAGTVISQSATSGHPKDVVNIVVSKGPEPATPPDPVTPPEGEGGGEGGNGNEGSEGGGEEPTPPQ